MDVRKSALIAHSAARTFDLIEAAEHYPKFLPWCADAVILERDASVVVARLTIDFHGLRFDLTTRNPKRPPHWMAIHAIDLGQGPVSHFEGEWQLLELEAHACRIEFSLHYEVDIALFGMLASLALDRIAGTMVEAFATRAKQVLPRRS